MCEEELRREQIIEELERTKWLRYWQTIRKDWMLYSMLLPGLIFLALFRYLPIGGILVAFKDFNFNTGLMNSDWRGFYFIKDLMFGSTYRTTEFWQAFRNTFSISMYGLLFGFPVPIILALFFSEIKNEFYRSMTQIITYLPKFISTVVITTLISLMLYGGSSSGSVSPGIIAEVFIRFGWINENEQMLFKPEYFRAIYTISGIWEGAGYGSIVYFAAIMGISPTNYEAAKIDGASKLAQIRFVTLPGMAPTLTIMLILRIGEILSVGYEKVLLLYNTDTYVTADVISTFVLRIGGLMQGGGSTVGMTFGGAADLFNSLISMCLVLGANFISRRVSDTSLF